MKKLVLKGGVFSAVILCICACIVKLSMTEPYRATIARWTKCEEFMDESGMLPCFEQAGTPDGTTRLIIGDSICRQMFGDRKSVV